MGDFEKQLKPWFKKMRKHSSPDSAWVKSSRKEMLAAVKQASVQKVEHFSTPVTQRSWFMRHMRAVSLALVLALVLGSGTTFVAQGAEPGDTLYPVKIASEDMSLLVTVSPQARARLHMKYADRRMGELERLYEKEPHKDWEEKVTRRINKHMDETHDHLMLLESVTDHTDLSLMFEEMTRRHYERIDALRHHLATSSAEVLDIQRDRHERHHDRAREALEHAQKRFDNLEHRHKDIEDRVHKRLEYLKERREKRDGHFKEYSKGTSLPSPPILFEIKDSPEDTTAAVDERTVIQQDEGKYDDPSVHTFHLDEEGTQIDIDVQVEGADTEDVDIEYDDTTGTTYTSVRVEGSNFTINSSSSITSSSSQRIIINSEETERE